MFWLYSLFLFFLVFYFVSSLIVFFISNSNVIPSKRHHYYEMIFPGKMKFLGEPKIAYWVIKQNKIHKSVVFLHGFIGSSNEMMKRGEEYYIKGYDLYFIDNLDHGNSDTILFPTGIQYAEVALKIIEHEQIKNPIIHGLSMGGIAAVYIANNFPDIPSAIVVEDIPYNFDNIHQQLFKLVGFPYKPFFWLSYVSKKIAWRKNKNQLKNYNLKNITCSVFYIHCAEDKMFTTSDHFDKIRNEFKNKTNFESWLVEGANHSEANFNKDFQHKISLFLDKINNK